VRTATIATIRSTEAEIEDAALVGVPVVWPIVTAAEVEELEVTPPVVAMMKLEPVVARPVVRTGGVTS